MAKKNEPKLNYPLALRELMEKGPGKLYLLWGPEDYLREHYVGQLKKLCLTDGEDSFSLKRLNGPELDPQELQQAVDAVPFLSERSFLEIRGVDLNHLPEGEKILSVLSDIPDYCTVALVQSAEFEPDGRIKLVKSLRSLAQEIYFSRQNQSELFKWIAKRFAAHGKGIEFEAAQRLIFVSGDLMNRLIPEIDKVAAYARGDKVTVADVDAVANHIPEAVVFDMTDLISQKRTNAALSKLAELLAEKSNEPIPMLAMLGLQMRRLYAARLALDRKLGAKYVMETCSCKYDFQANQLLQAARGYTMEQLVRAVELCAEADYRMKSESLDDRELFKEVVVRIASGDSHA
jgi:DNA polymerase-3 subunit delta